MSKLSALVVAVSIALTASASAFAADAPITLRVDAGNVMASQGGEFATAQTGKALSVGERLMIVENSAATVLYDSGCSKTYDVPGVYAVPADCVPVAVAGGAAGTDWAAAGAITGGVLVGAAILANMDQKDYVPPPPAPPVSP